jgi:uncharacterized membrane protein
MRRFRPLLLILTVIAFAGLVMAADFVIEGGLSKSSYIRVSPERDGLVHIPVGDLGQEQVRFYRFLNTGNQEVKFFVGRDAHNTVQVAFDANELCFKLKRGYRHDGAWVVCNKCDRSFRLDEVNSGGGGCTPIPVEHQIAGNELLLSENALLAGWRYFR